MREAESFDHIGSVVLDDAGCFIRILETARDIARERWGLPTRSGYADMCVVLCIAAVRPTSEHTRARLYRYFGEANGIRKYNSAGRAYGSLVSQWNDKPGRTKGEVLRGFDRTIEYVRQHNYQVRSGAVQREPPAAHRMPGLGVNR